MKKILLSLCVFFVALASVAQNYNENLTVTINGETTSPIPASITVVRNDNGTCDFVLKNFILTDGESEIPVGNINLKGVTMEDKGSYQAISTNQVIAIEPGDDPNIPWIGPDFLTEVPIVLSGKITDSRLAATIDIDMNDLLGQVIKVVVGDEKTGIVNVSTSAPVHAVYSLSGIRVADKMNSSLPKGVYIVGGKKVIKK